MDERTDLEMHRLQRAIDLLRDTDPHLPGQVISVFLYVAAHENCRTSHMSLELGLPPSSISRCTDYLSDYHRLGKAGLDLIKKKRDLMDQRIKLCSLTPKGKELIEKLRTIVYS